MKLFSALKALIGALVQPVLESLFGHGDSRGGAAAGAGEPAPQALTDVQVRALTPAQVSALSTQALNALTSPQFSLLSTVQAQALTTTQLPSLETQDLRALATASLAALSPVQLDALGHPHLAALSTTQLAALTPAQLASLDSGQIQALNTAHIVALSSAQAQALTPEQIGALTTTQVAALESRDIAVMSTAQIQAFGPEDVAVMSGAQLDAFILATPIMLDLAGKGIQTLAAKDGVEFELVGAGSAARWGWAGEGTGLLVRDRNHDGVINDGTELYGMATKNTDGTRAGDGFAAMALEDSNHDGKLSAMDANWGELQLWLDANHDGRTDAGELKPLGELGIVELDLAASAGTELNQGNLIGLVSSYTRADGTQHAMADVWVARDAPAKLADLLAAPAAELLPAATAASRPAPTDTPAHFAMGPHRRWWAQEDQGPGPLV